jgi:hypothetical protein
MHSEQKSHEAKSKNERPYGRTHTIESANKHIGVGVAPSAFWVLENKFSSDQDNMQ